MSTHFQRPKTRDPDRPGGLSGDPGDPGHPGSSRRWESGSIDVESLVP